MKTKLLVAAAITVTFAGSALADFYVIEDQTTHKCTIVSQPQKPMPSMTEVIVGDSVYNSQQEAEVAMRTDKTCANTPMGSGSTTTTPNPRGPSATPPRPYR
jgi:hypothetical protein